MKNLLLIILANVFYSTAIHAGENKSEPLFLKGKNYGVNVSRGMPCFYDSSGFKCVFISFPPFQIFTPGYQEQPYKIDIEIENIETARFLNSSTGCMLYKYADESKNRITCNNYGILFSKYGKRYTDFINIKSPTELAGGLNHICAIADKKVLCLHAKASEIELVLPEFTNPHKLVARNDTSCVIDEDAVKCWGENSNLSRPSTMFKNPRELALGNNTACAIDDIGVKCWSNKNEMDFKISTDISKPRKLSITHESKFSSDIESLCILDEFGVRCWNPSGEILKSIDLKGHQDLINNGKLDIIYNSTMCVSNAQKIMCELFTSDIEGKKVTARQIELTAMSNPTKLMNTGSFICGIDRGLKCTGDRQSIDDFRNKINIEGKVEDLLYTFHDIEIFGLEKEKKKFNNFCVLDSKGVKCLLTQLDSRWKWERYNICKKEHVITKYISGNFYKISRAANLICGISENDVQCVEWKAINTGMHDYPYATEYCIKPQDTFKVGDFNFPVSVEASYSYSSGTSALDICVYDIFGKKCNIDKMTNSDFAQFFYKEKAIPLSLARELRTKEIENKDDAYLLMFIENKFIKSLFVGYESEEKPNLEKLLNDLESKYATANAFNMGYIAQRNLTALRYILNIVASSLTSSKYLLSTLSKQTVDNLLLTLSQVLSGNDISISTVSELLGMLKAESGLMSEMQSSHRLVGIKTFYDWAYQYVSTGKVE